MLPFKNYSIKTEIYSSTNSVVYRANRLKNNEAVILKVFRDTYPSAEQIVALKQEFSIISTLNIEGVIKGYSLETDQNRWVIAMEDFGGTSLAQLNMAGTLRLKNFLNLALKVSHILDQIHQQQIIHNDINSTNVVYNPNTAQVKIIDFDIATVLSRENPVFYHDNLLKGTLSHISPEQTGRMNRGIDHRTDLYSLGITFYQLLTGQLPYQEDDAMALIHSHIAREPVPIYKLKTDIPPTINDIIIKLMAKNAEDRYQSAFGLNNDLKKCLAQLNQTNNIQPFNLAENDFSSQFIISQKLYGRQKETEILQQAFQQIYSPPFTISKSTETTKQTSSLTQTSLNQKSLNQKSLKNQGRFKLIFVTGSPGVGKTMLVNQIHKTTIAKQGFFITGKFHQQHRHNPYYAWIQIFTDFINQLLTQKESKLLVWKEAILHAVGDNGKVLTDIIPALTLLIGNQPDVPELEADSAQNRLNFLFTNFIKAITNPNHPLVIFIDNLQWADSASLNLLTTITTHFDYTNLFIIGAYQNHNLSATHPLTSTLRTIHSNFEFNLDSSYHPLESITLANFSVEDVNNLIADTLNSNQLNTKPLAKLVYQKTQGNPFFVKQFLTMLYKEALLHFDFSSLKPSSEPSSSFTNKNQGWQWNLSKIKKLDITDNVVSFLTAQIQKLDSDTQFILKLAACIGNQFDLTMLSIIAQQPHLQVKQQIQRALLEGLILAISAMHPLNQSNAKNRQYKFAHNHIQQAVYSLISDQQKKQTHLQIGQLLLKNIPVSNHEDYIFDIVNHFNLALDILNTDTNKHQAAQLNLMAGKKAKDAAAYQSAFNYLQIALNLLPPNSWQTHYSFTLSLYTQAAEAAYLSANLKLIPPLIEAALQNAVNLLDKIKIYQIHIQAYLVENKLQQAIKLGLKVLQFLDINLPYQPTQTDIQVISKKIEAILKRTQITTLAKLPLMTAPTQLAAMRIMNSLFAPAYLAIPTLRTLLVLNQVSLSLKYGNAPESAFAYANYGLILCGEKNDIRLGYQFGQLALTLSQKLDVKKEKAKTLVNVNFFINHWQQAAAKLLKPLLQAYQVGLETGEITFAAYALHDYCLLSYFSGQNLIQLDKKMDSYAETIAQLKQPRTLMVNKLYRQVIYNLIHGHTSPYILEGSFYNEKTMLPQHKHDNDKTALCVLFFNKMSLSYLFQNYPQAVEYADIAHQHLDALTSTMIVPIFYFYHSLAHLSIYPNCLPPQQVKILEAVLNNLKKIKIWAKHSPANYQHKYYLIKAKYAEVTGDTNTARSNYEQAIVLAKKNGYLNEEALARELLSQFYLSQQQHELAQYYLQTAHQVYTHWGAHAKVRDLEEQHRDFFVLEPTQWSTNSTSKSISSSSKVTKMNTLDVVSIVKASQALSEEIVLDKLLQKIIRTVLENAGAQYGSLILQQQGQWFIEAKGNSGNKKVEVLQSIPLKSLQVTDLPMSIINYVARTAQNVVLNNACKEGNFTKDDYILAHNPQSILCVPLITQTKLIGILYLENNLTTHAFTAQRIQMVTLLGTQVAISINNARAIAAQAEQERLQLKQERLQLEQEHLRLRNQVLQKEADVLAKLNADKDKFFSIVSHDLRSPFTALIGGSELLYETIDQLQPHSIQKISKNIYNSAKSAFNLLENLLAWSRMQRGHMRYEPDQVMLNELAQNTVDLLEQMAQQKEITLRNLIPFDLFILADSYMIETVIRNLTSNALKYTLAGGQVAISAKLDNFSQNQDDSLAHQFVIVSIADTGIGISPKDSSKLFRIDTHHTTPGTAKERGTGLGLIICQEMVEKNGGRIWIESELGQGTHVNFTVPLHEATPRTVLNELINNPIPSIISTNHQSESSNKNELLVIPPPQINLLRELALEGDVQGITEQINTIEEQSDQFTAFTSNIRDMINDFEIEAALEFIEQFTE